MWGLVCKYATYRLTSSTWPPKGQWLLPLLRFLPLVPVNEVSKPSLSIALRNTDIKRMRINYNNAYRVYRIHQKRIKCYHLLILSQLSEMRTRGCRGANLAAPLESLIRRTNPRVLASHGIQGRSVHLADDTCRYLKNYRDPNHIETICDSGGIEVLKQIKEINQSQSYLLDSFLQKNEESWGVWTLTFFL